MSPCFLTGLAWGPGAPLGTSPQGYLWGPEGQPVDVTGVPAQGCSLTVQAPGGPPSRPPTPGQLLWSLAHLGPLPPSAREGGTASSREPRPQEAQFRPPAHPRNCGAQGDPSPLPGGLEQQEPTRQKGPSLPCLPFPVVPAGAPQSEPRRPHPPLILASDPDESEEGFARSLAVHFSVLLHLHSDFFLGFMSYFKIFFLFNFQMHGDFTSYLFLLAPNITASWSETTVYAMLIFGYLPRLDSGLTRGQFRK